MFICNLLFVLATFRLRGRQGRPSRGGQRALRAQLHCGAGAFRTKERTAGNFYIPLCIVMCVGCLWWCRKRYRECPKSSGLGGVGSGLVVEGAV